MSFNKWLIGLTLIILFILSVILGHKAIKALNFDTVGASFSESAEVITVSKEGKETQVLLACAKHGMLFGMVTDLPLQKGDFVEVSYNVISGNVVHVAIIGLTKTIHFEIPIHIHGKKK